MFIGHYGVSFAAKRWAPRLSLGWLFLAVQALDVLFGVFVLCGVERLRIVPLFTAYNAYDLYDMPYTHGLAGALLWSLALGLVARALLGRRSGATPAAVVLGLCVFSHWLLDVPMHTADMPLLGNDSPKVGLGLWNHRNLSLAAEAVALLPGVWLWLHGSGGLARARAATVTFLLLLVATLLTTPFMPPPSSPKAFAVSALVAYVAFAAAAAGLERLRARAGAPRT